MPVGLALAVLLFLVSRVNYPLFHCISDMAAVFIAGSVFLVVWNGRRHLDNHYYLLVAMGFLAFAGLDFMHLIGNKGMGVFPQYGNLGPSFYIANRYVLGVSFLLAPLFIKRKLNVFPVLAVYLLAVAVVLLSILVWGVFPKTFIEGKGLTTFKVYSDYAVCLMLLGGLGLLIRNRGAFETGVLRVIALSLVLFIATGLAFTLYADPFGITNAIGHLFQIAAFCFIYLGFVDTVLTKPQTILYRNLKQSKERILGLNAELKDLNLNLNRDIAARKKVEAALRESEHRLRLFIEHAPASLAMFDRQMRHLSASRRWIHDYGLKDRVIIGQSIYDVFSELPDRWRELHRRALAGEVLRMEEDSFRRADGSTQWLRWEIRPWREAGGEIAGIVIFTEDITGRKKAEESLRQANECLAQAANDLSRSNDDLQQFARIVSHDLREPLRTISGFLSLLHERYRDRLDDKAMEYIDFSIEGAGRMSNLIRDLIEYARVERKGKAVRNVDTGQAIVSATANLRAAIQNAQATVTHDTMPDVPGDPTLLSQLLQNLIANSVKFRAAGRPCKIHVGVDRKDNHWEFSVKDNGIGIDPAFSDRIFSVFQRLHTREQYEGTGIGLAICKKIVERYGGRIWVESEPGKGATFYFTIRD
ncbi:MAG: MASE3 domain-containing protein [Kiritimatiellia bacterium]